MKGGRHPSTFQAAHVYEKVLLQVVGNPSQRLEIAHTVLWEVRTEIEDREIMSLTVAVEPKIQSASGTNDDITFKNEGQISRSACVSLKLCSMDREHCRDHIRKS